VGGLKDGTVFSFQRQHWTKVSGDFKSRCVVATRKKYLSGNVITKEFRISTLVLPIEDPQV